MTMRLGTDADVLGFATTHAPRKVEPMPARPSHGPTTDEPLYVMVAESLRRRILSGQLRPGDQLPTEHELCEVLHVSRITVRRGIDLLVHERLVYRRRPTGTFVSMPDDADSTGHSSVLHGATGETRGIGDGSATIMAKARLEPADVRVAQALGIAPGAEVFSLRRVRGDGDTPFVHCETHLTGFGNLPLDDDAYLGSLYGLLASQGIVADRIEEEVQAVRAPRDVRDALGIGRGEPVLRRTRRARQSGGPFHELTVCHYIGERFRYCVEMGGIVSEGHGEGRPPCLGQGADAS